MQLSNGGSRLGSILEGTAGTATATSRALSTGLPASPASAAAAPATPSAAAGAQPAVASNSDTCSSMNSRNSGVSGSSSEQQGFASAPPLGQLQLHTPVATHAMSTPPRLPSHVAVVSTKDSGVWGWLQPAPGCTKLPLVLLQGQGVAIGRGREAFEERLPHLLASRASSATSPSAAGSAASSSLLSPTATTDSVAPAGSNSSNSSSIPTGREGGGSGSSGFVEVADGRVSRLHAWVKWDSKRRQALLQDLSTNGTYCNGQRVGRGQALPLSDGDRVQLVLSLAPLAELAYVYRSGDPRSSHDSEAGGGRVEDSARVWEQQPLSPGGSPTSPTCTGDGSGGAGSGCGGTEAGSSPRQLSSPFSSASRGSSSSLSTPAAGHRLDAGAAAAAAAARRRLARSTTSTYSSLQATSLEDLQCQICLSTLRDCVALEPCGHNFCAACLSHHLAALLGGGQPLACPLRCSPPERVVVNAPVRQLLASFRQAQRHSRQRQEMWQEQGQQQQQQGVLQALPEAGSGNAAAALLPGAAEGKGGSHLAQLEDYFQPAQEQEQGQAQEEEEQQAQAAAAAAAAPGAQPSLEAGVCGSAFAAAAVQAVQPAPGELAAEPAAPLPQYRFVSLQLPSARTGSGTGSSASSLLPPSPFEVAANRLLPFGSGSSSGWGAPPQVLTPEQAAEEAALAEAPTVQAAMPICGGSDISGQPFEATQQQQGQPQHEGQWQQQERQQQGQGQRQGQQQLFSGPANAPATAAGQGGTGVASEQEVPGGGFHPPGATLVCVHSPLDGVFDHMPSGGLLDSSPASPDQWGSEAGGSDWRGLGGGPRQPSFIPASVTSGGGGRGAAGSTSHSASSAAQPASALAAALPDVDGAGLQLRLPGDCFSDGGGGGCGGEEGSGPMLPMHPVCPLHDSLLPLDTGSLKSRQLAHSLHLLRSADNEDSAMTHLEALARLAWSDEAAREELGGLQGVQAIVDCMARVDSDAVQCNGCLALMALVRGDGAASDANRLRLADCGGVQVIADGMCRYLDVPMVQLSALLCLVPLALENTELQVLVARCCLPVILASIQHHPQEVEVVAKGLVMLGVLGQGDEDVHEALRKTLMDHSPYPRIVAAVLARLGTESEEVLWAALFSLAVVARDSSASYVSHMVKLAAAGVLPALEASLTAYRRLADEQAIEPDDMILRAGDFLIAVLRKARKLLWLRRTRSLLRMASVGLAVLAALRMLRRHTGGARLGGAGRAAAK